MKIPPRGQKKNAGPDRSPQTRDFLASLIVLMNTITRRRMSGGLRPDVVQLLSRVNTALITPDEPRDEMEEEITGALVKELYEARDTSLPTPAVSSEAWAGRMLDAWFADPVSERELTPIITLAGMWNYANTPTDSEGWNDRFALAVLCALPFERRQEAAWCALSNGMLGYWQMTTRSGYRMSEAMQCLGVTLRLDTSRKAEGPGFAWLHDETLNTLARLFRLPTRRAGVDHLTHDQQQLRETLARCYPRHSPL